MKTTFTWSASIPNTAARGSTWNLARNQALYSAPIVVTIDTNERRLLFARTSIGGLLLDDVEGWTFTVQQDVITGKFRDDPGILRITTVKANTLPHPVTH